MKCSVLGIVGGIGAGKSTVVKQFEEKSLSYTIGVDELGHQILLKGQEAYEAVVHAFGTTILDDQGEIVRRRLGAIVFTDQEKLKRLNQITHPILYRKVKEIIETQKTKNKYRFILIDAALLVEIGLVELTDYIIGVYADELVRIERVMKREGISKEAVINRISKQKKWKQLEQLCDEVIDNSGNPTSTRAQIDELIDKLG